MVEEGDSLIPAIEDEMVGVEHLLSEARYGNASEDDINYMCSADTEKYLALEDFPCSDEICKMDTEFGISYIHATKDEGQCPDGIIQPKYKDECLKEIGRHPDCFSDYLLDEFGEENCYLQFDLHTGYYLGNISAEYPEIVEVDSDADERWNLSKNMIPRSEERVESHNENALSISNINIYGNFKGNCGPVTSQHQVKQDIICGPSDLMNANDTHKKLESRFFPKGHGDKLFLSSTDLSETTCGALTSAVDQTNSNETLKKINADKDAISANFLVSGRCRLLEFESRDDSLVTTKRMRKPTRRYIEESSDMKPIQCTVKCGFPGTGHQNKISHTSMISAPMEQIHSENSYILSHTQMPNIIQSRRGRPKKTFTCIVKDLKGKKRDKQNTVDHKRICASMLMESAHENILGSSHASGADKCVARRKHHRLWSLSEVTKLVDGVSRYGVGRWTDIKRLMFSSYAYRTSVDLKDKWRNLLRASGVQIPGGKEIESRKKHMPGLVPQSILRRVRDLATLHPYPRKQKAGPPQVAPLPPRQVKDGSPCRRVVHRRQST